MQDLRTGSAPAWFVSRVVVLRVARVRCGRVVVRTRNADGTQIGWRDGDTRPHRAFGLRALGHQHGLVAHAASVRELQHGQRALEVERVSLKALFSERLGGRAEAVRVASAMVVANLPAHLRLSTNFPHHVCWHLRQGGPVLAMPGVRGIDVVACFGTICSPWPPSREPAGVSDGRVSRRTPAIENKYERKNMCMC